MAYRFQPQSPYGAPIAPAVSGSSMLAQVLGITALGLCVTALAAWLFQDVAYGLGLVAMIVGFILLLTINAARRNEALRSSYSTHLRFAKASASRRSFINTRRHSARTSSSTRR